MKQYLKQIKRHFPKLDSCCFQLTQVLHLTTESGGEGIKDLAYVWEVQKNTAA